MSYTPALLPGQTTLSGTNSVPSEGAVYPSGQTHPGQDQSVFLSRKNAYWKEPIDWQRTTSSDFRVYYEEFVRPVKQLQSGHIKTPGSWLSIFSTNPEAGTVAWNESDGALRVFDGGFWQTISTTPL